MKAQYTSNTAQYVETLPAPAPETLDDPEEVLSILFNPRLRGPLYPYYSRLRELDPVYRTHNEALCRGQPCWVLTSYRSGYEAFTHRQMTSDSRTLQAYDSGEGGKQWMAMMKRVLLFLEQTDHVRVRKMVATTFMRRKVEEFRPFVVETIEHLLARMEERGHADIVSDFANPLPITMIFRIFGMPIEDLHLIETWMSDFARRGELGKVSPEVERGGEAAARGFTDYFLSHVADRRKHPRDDVITTFVQARDDEGKGLTDEELVAMCVLIFMAGHESTSNMIAFNTLSLLRNPDQLDLLKRQPALIEDGIDELIRYDASVHVAQRVGINDVTLCGREVPAGEPCLIMQGAANHDPEQYDSPERLDLTREKVQHLVFGLGSHSCLGNQLAKLELRLAIPALVDRFPGIRLAVPFSEVKSCNTGLLLRHLRDLPVAW